jgi:hypothetical protein
MKKLILILLILVSFSCKYGNKENVKSENLETINKSKEDKEPKVLNKLVLPSHTLWSFVRLSFEENTSSKERLDAFKVTRTSIDETAYAVVNETPIIYGSKYRISINAKKGDNGHLFGLRAIGEYPHRIDAVFDLKNGLVKDNKSSGDFIEGRATIAPLENDWYKCTIISELDADMVKIIFGPTSGLRKTIAWEAQTKDFCDVFVVPSSLTIEELSH